MREIRFMGIVLNPATEDGPTYIWRIKDADQPIGIDLGALADHCSGDITADLARALWLIPNEVVVRVAHTSRSGTRQGVEGKVLGRDIDGRVRIGRLWVDATRVEALVIVSDDRFDQTCSLCEATPDEPCLRHRIPPLRSKRKTNTSFRSARPRNASAESPAQAALLSSSPHEDLLPH